MNADCEVKKLKDLVKKLERQNQHLRYKTGKLGPHRNSASANDLLSDGSDESHKSGTVSRTLPALDDSFDECYLKSINNADDTCWLFSVGKGSEAEDRDALEIWLRHDLEHPPTAALALAKRNILNSLGPSISVESRQQHQYNETTVTKSPVRLNEEVGFHQDYYNKDEVVDSRQMSHHVHHMPLPSHSTASVHGLIPNDGGDQFPRSPSSRGSRQQWDSGDRVHRNQSPLRDNRHQSPVRATRHQSPSRAARQPSPTRATRQQSPARTARQPSPSRGTRQHMPLPSQTAPPGWSASNVSDAVYHSTTPSASERAGRHRSPSPGQRSHRSPSPIQRNHRSPSPSYGISSQSSLRSLTRGSPSVRTDVAAVLDKNQGSRRIPGPSTPRSARTTNLRKEGALTPRLAATEKFASDRNTRNASTLYSSGTPKGQSGIPGRKSGLPSSRGLGGKHLKYLQTSELRGAVSSEELYAGSTGDGNSDTTRTLTPRRYLPRPSRSTKGQYSNLNYEYSKYGRADSVRSLDLHRSESIRSDETASEASDVWKDGEFF